MHFTFARETHAGGPYSSSKPLCRQIWRRWINSSRKSRRQYSQISLGGSGASDCIGFSPKSIGLQTIRVSSVSIL
jgi:hypothetical protein